MLSLDQLPPTPKGKRYEIQGLGLRQFAGLKRDDQPLDPFELAGYANLLVAPFEAINDLSDTAREHLLGNGKNAWSGGAASLPLPDGRKLIILNPTHPRTRQRATLMEEISHVFLGHKPSRLAIERRDKHGRIIARDYNHAIEEEAYSTGAAALLPYSAIKRMIEQGKTSREIARHFYVSSALVEYRIKVSKLWDLYKTSIFSGKH